MTQAQIRDCLTDQDNPNTNVQQKNKAICILTRGFLNSLGLMHRTKKGWQRLRVFIRESKDFLNCEASVGARFLVSVPWGQKYALHKMSVRKHSLFL